MRSRTAGALAHRGRACSGGFADREGKRLREVAAGVVVDEPVAVRLADYGLQSNKTTLERAFELARSGKYRTIRELIRELSSEGYSAEQVEGKQVRTQLLRLVRAPKAEGDPVAENGEGRAYGLERPRNDRSDTKATD
jgi:hypothetical protein